MAEIGHCKHGEFNLFEGCPQCVLERLAKQLKEKLKPIPAGSKIIGEANPCFIPLNVKIIPEPEPVGVPNRSVPNETEAVIRVDSGACLAPTAIALRPGEDVEVRSYFEEAVKLLDYSKSRTIKTLDDAKSATFDLSAISRLKKAMEAKRKEYLAPHEAQVKAIRETYNYLMSPVLEAERITKEKQVAFIHEQECIQREQESINQKRLEQTSASVVWLTTGNIRYLTQSFCLESIWCRMKLCSVLSPRSITTKRK